MAQEDFDRLIDGICKTKSIARTKEQSEAFHLLVSGVLFTLAPSPNHIGDIDALGYFCDFGLLPDNLPHSLVLRRLLESNLFLFGADLPRFTCNPETGHVLLVGRVPLGLMSGDTVIQLLDQVADYARRWSESHFLEDNERAQYTEPVHFGSSTTARSMQLRAKATT